MLKKIFWSKWMTWFRKLLGAPSSQSFEEYGRNKPIYTMGRADPICTTAPVSPQSNSYGTFSGVDVKVFVQEDNDGDFLCLSEVQAISAVYEYVYDNGEKLFGNVRGDIHCIIFDEDVLANLLFTPKNILLVSANEYGSIAYTKFLDVQFKCTKWGVAIDDLVTETTTEFTAERCIPWKNICHPDRWKDWKELTDKRINDNLRKFV